LLIINTINHLQSQPLLIIIRYPSVINTIIILSYSIIIVINHGSQQQSLSASIKGISGWTMGSPSYYICMDNCQIQNYHTIFGHIVSI